MDYTNTKEEVNDQAEDCPNFGVLTDECEIDFKDIPENDINAIFVAEDVQDSWTIEPNIDNDGKVEIPIKSALDVDISDALELGEVAVGRNLASRGLLF